MAERQETRFSARGPAARQMLRDLAEVPRLREVNADLLAALEAFMAAPIVSTNVDPAIVCRLQEQARAAIARARNGVTNAESAE